MDLGWKWLIPISLVWIMLVATLRTAQNQGWLASPLFWTGAGALFVLVFAVWWWLDREEPPAEIEPDRSEPFDAFAGGFPVPPMPGQRLPDLADVVSSSVDEQAGEK
jgi:NADH-quinone oxidoreductase subunit H